MRQTKHFVFETLFCDPETMEIPVTMYFVLLDYTVLRVKLIVLNSGSSAWGTHALLYASVVE